MEIELFKRAATIRHFEEKLLDLFSQGRLSGTVHTSIGQELCALAVVDQLEEGDWIFSNHRCHGHYLAWSDNVRGLLAEIMGKASGICGGRGGSQHIFHDQFLSNGVQGGGVPIAAGCALALTMLPDSTSLAVAFIGDGTLGQGVVYETLNLAQKWKVPLLVVLEHNGYAQSTKTTDTISGTIRGRFEAFGWKFWESSIWAEKDLLGQAGEAVDYVRTHRSPGALCIDCYRLKAHSKGDDNRESSEIASYLQRDPLVVFEQDRPDAAKQARAECDRRLQTILAELDAEPVSNNGNTNGHSALKSFPLTHHASRITPSSSSLTKERVVERLRTGLKNLLTHDDKVILLGEDVEDPYGGAFKVTKGLSNSFPGRVRGTPISEATIVGVGNGLAVAGFRPIVEIMFGDFITLAADQIINQASKFSYMYNGQVEVPIIIRTPMGGKRGYGATHSQSLEKHFFGTPGLHIVAVNCLFDPALLLERVHDTVRGPCLFIENKLLYTSYMREKAADGRRWSENGALFPTLKLDSQGPADLTIVAYGGMVDEVEEAVKRAFLEEEIIAEVLVPTMIHPLDISPIVESVAKTRRLLVVEEGQGFGGFGAEVIAACSEALRGQSLTTGRVCAAGNPIPSAKDLELQALPDAARVFEAMQNLVKA
jgi:2-oxoisovalerate dehydrogenase E1 component